MVLAVAGTAGRPLPRSPGGSSSIDAASVLERQVSFPDFTASSSEFLPRAADYADRLDGEVRQFGLYERMFPEAAWLAGRLLVWQGDVGVDAVSGGALWTAADVSVEGAAGTLAFHQLRFPGWRAWVDGRAVPVRASPGFPSRRSARAFCSSRCRPAATGWRSASGRAGPAWPGRCSRSRRPSAWASRCSGAGRATPGPRPGRPPWRPALGVALCAAVRRLHLAAARAAGGARGRRAGGWAGRARPRPDRGRPVWGGGRRFPLRRDPGARRFVDVRYLAVRAGDRPLADAGPRSRRWLFAHPPTDVAVDVDVPADAYLQTGMALDPATWEAPLGDGVEFTVTLTPLPGAGRGAPARA